MRTAYINWDGGVRYWTAFLLGCFTSNHTDDGYEYDTQADTQDAPGNRPFVGK